MARTSLTVTTTAAQGAVLPAMAAVDQPNGNQFLNTGRELIEVTNGSGSTITVTFITNGVYTVGTVQYAIADSAQTIAAGATKAFGPFDKTLYNDGTGQVLVDYTSGTTVTARVISLGTA